MIAEIKDTVFEKYQVRKSAKQKAAFIEYIKGVCDKNGISCNIEVKGSNRNIVMGATPEDSEVVVTAHYDTCAKMILPNFITPKNFFIYLLYQLLITGLIIGIGIAAGFACGNFISQELTLPVYGITVFVLLMLLVAGPANKHTANDNTSGVITVLNSMLSMTPEQRSKVCFVLFDNEETGLQGSAAFNKMHRKTMKNKPLINFDCVSDGDYLFAKLTKKDKNSDFGKKFTEIFEKHAKAFGMIPEIGATGFYPSDQANFKHGIGVASLNRSKIVGLYMNRIHTSKDTVFNERNIECLTAAMVEFVGNN